MKPIIFFCLFMIIAAVGFPQTATPEAQVDTQASETVPQIPLDLLQDTPATSSSVTPPPTEKKVARVTRSKTVTRQTTETQVVSDASGLPQALPGEPNAGPPLIRPPAPQIQAMIERIRVNRSLIFRRTAEAAKSASSPSPEAEMWQPVMTLQFRLIPPTGWEITGVQKAEVTHAVDQSGMPVINSRESRAARTPEVMSGLTPLVDIGGRGAVVLLRTEPPPPGTVSFQELTARFEVTLGQRQVMRVPSVPAQVGRPILRESGLTDLAMEISEATREHVVVRALGNLDRLGDVHFETSAGEPIQPITSETLIPESSEQTSHPLRQWNFSFTELPADYNMTIELYPESQKSIVNVQLKDLNLP